MQDHPIIKNLEQTGWPDGNTPQYPSCPACGSQAEDFYKNEEREVIGCCDCIHAVSWEDVLEEGLRC